MTLWTSDIGFSPIVPCVGIDPGRQLGISLIMRWKIYAFYCVIPKQETTFLTGVQAIQIMRAWQEKFLDLRHPYVAVEGASYNERYGQDNLSQIRFALSYALYSIDSHLDQVPPATARKLAFGDGKVTGKQLWPEINNNAADAVGLALAAYSLSGQSGAGRK